MCIFRIYSRCITVSMVTARTDLWLDLVGCPEAEQDDELLPGRGDLLLRLHALHQAVGPLHHPRSPDTQQHVSRVTCTSRMLDTWPAARLPCRPRLPASRGGGGVWPLVAPAPAPACLRSQTLMSSSVSEMWSHGYSSEMSLLHVVWYKVICKSKKAKIKLEIKWFFSRCSVVNVYFVWLLTAISTCSLRNCRELFLCRRRLLSALSPPGSSPDVISSSCLSPNSPWTSSSRCLAQQLTDHLQLVSVSKLNWTFR